MSNRSVALLSVLLLACGSDGRPDVTRDGDTFVLGASGQFEKSIDVSQVPRSYLLYVPASAHAAMTRGTSTPVLVALHGAGDTGDGFVSGAALEALVEANAAVLIAPDAYNKVWGASRAEGWPGTGGSQDAIPNDIAFVLQALEETARSYRIDATRYYVTGFSRGAGFAATLATASSIAYAYRSPFAAHAICAGFDVFNGARDFSQTDPKRPVWIIHGTADGSVPFSLGQALGERLMNAGWPDVTFTRIQGASHRWLWSEQFGHSNQELWDWFTRSSSQ